MNSYYDIIQKEIKLPSGATVSVRRQTKLEAILIGQPPAFFMRNARLQEKGQPIPDDTEQDRQAFNEFIARQNRIILTRCVVGPLLLGESPLAIVDKEPGKEDIGEISWALIRDDDADAIITASNELTRIDKTGREAVKTFPQESEVASGAGSNLTALPLPPDRPAQAIAG